MKVLILLMLFFSVFMGIPTNKAFFSLYGSEFLGVISMIKAGTYPAIQLVCWILLLITHAGMVSLLFLTNKSYFGALLMIIPFLFIFFYIFSTDILIIVLLIPFIIVWIIAIIWQSGNKKA